MRPHGGSRAYGIVIYICVRKTTDWEDEQVFLGQLRDGFRAKVDVWNATFTMPFHLFRHRVKEIAQLNLSRVENARCAPLSEIPEGSLVVPVDDDDWFAPELGAVLEAEREPGKAGYYWERGFLESPPGLAVRAGRFVRYTMLGRSHLRWTCSTNNYAILKTNDVRALVVNHVAASAYFDEHASEVKRLPRHLSLMNRTLASQTSMAWRKPTVTRRELVTKFHRYQRLYSSFEHPELAWAGPYVRMMGGLMKELRTR
jgi:hypothetical protein